MGIGVVALLTACSAIEQERRPSGATIYEAPAPFSAGTSEVASSSDVTVPASEAPSIYAQSAILIDARTGRTLWEKNPDMRRQVASTQKLLTALLVIERGNLDGMATVQAVDTYVEPTKLFVKPGQSYPRRSLLTAMMVKSSNDAAHLLARDHSGSVAAFAAAMNRRAAELGATSSYFVNPSGLPAAQYSTARDVSRIAFAAYRSSDLRSMMRLPSYTFRYTTGGTKYLEATNKLLKRSLMFDGMKTGYTNAAGRCLVTSASIGGRSLILVQLGSKTRYIFDDAERVIRWGFGRSGEAYAAR